MFKPIRGSCAETGGPFVCTGILYHSICSTAMGSYIPIGTGPHPLYRAGPAELSVDKTRWGFHTADPNRLALTQYALTGLSYGGPRSVHQSQGPGRVLSQWASKVNWALTRRTLIGFSCGWPRLGFYTRSGLGR